MTRKLTQADWEEYRRLRLLSLTTNPDVYFSSLEEVSRWPESNFKSEIYSHQDSHFGYIGAYVDGKLVGYISLSGQYFAKQKHIADVFNLYVDPAYRGTGIARELVAAVISSARSTGTIEKLFLSVMSQNIPAISLYASLGFRVYGTKRHSLKSGDQYFDETLMELELNIEVIE